MMEFGMLEEYCYFLWCSGFLLLPLVLATLFMILINTTDRPGCGPSLWNVALALLYPLSVPAVSIYESGKLILGVDDEETTQTGTRSWRMFEHLGQCFLLIIL